MFIIIPANVLNKVHLSGDQKIIIGFLRAFTQKGKKYFGGLEFMAKECGINQDVCKNILEGFEKRGLISVNGFNITFRVDVETDELDLERAIMEEILGTPASNSMQGYKERGFECEYVTKQSFKVKIPDTQEWVLINHLDEEY